MTTPGTIAVTSLPGWPTPLPGVREAIDTALRTIGLARATISPDGLSVDDVATATAAMNAYAGGAAELAFNKTRKQAALDAAFDANFDLSKFIRGGTATGVTAANVGAFLATITNNYRSLRASIAAAANVAAVNAINVNTGWPSNP